MKLIPLISLVAISFAAFSHISSAEEKVESDTLIVAELFTSQGCSSCPPAEKLFSKLADQDNVLTLEWHVDYWDDLVHGGSRWKDVYSSDAFTNRQRAYNQTLRGVRNVYTPQAIVNGRLEGVETRLASGKAIKRRTFCLFACSKNIKPMLKGAKIRAASSPERTSFWPQRFWGKREL